MYLPIPSALADWLTSAYATLARFNISVPVLAVIAVVFGLALLFAVREAASWFFKVDDMKRNLRKLQRSMFDLESEIRALHNLVEATQKGDATSNGPRTAAMEPPRLPLSAAAAPSPTQENRAATFPISH